MYKAVTLVNFKGTFFDPPLLCRGMNNLHGWVQIFDRTQYKINLYEFFKAHF